MNNFVPTPFTERKLWTMERIEDWVNQGCDPTDPEAPNWAVLTELQNDGLIQLDGVRSGGKATMLLVSMTALGMYEAARLRANPPPPAPRPAPENTK